MSERSTQAGSWTGLRARVARWLGVPVREAHEVCGIRVLVDNGRADIATTDVLDRLREALELVERYQPWRLRHLRRDLAQILVARFPCRGAYFPADRTCLTELTFLARRDITAATVASSIVHEGVHARVAAWRARGASDAPHARDMAREERLCRAAELAFGRALPAALGAPVVERATASMALDDQDVAPEIDWALAQARQDAADREAGGAR